MGRARGGLTVGQTIALVVALLVIDLVVIAWLVYGYGITGWADGYDAPEQAEAPHVAEQAAWFLAGAAAVTGGGLLLARRPGVGLFQLAVLGGAAALFATLAAR
ncbi:hypothetical protein [Streptomyces sp. NPDC004267]|uniref:hypothetical protein n=1 Tax=Streptomyces sp. NPDC004267 TaxID=3364694 RepID=UPI00368108E9